MTAKRRGRPPKPPGQARSCKTVVALTPLVDEALRIHAARRGVTKAALCATILEEQARAWDEAERKNGELRTLRAAQHAAEARAATFRQSARAVSSASQEVAPGVRGAGLRLAEAARNIGIAKTRQREPFPEAPGEFSRCRKSNPPGAGTMAAREHQSERQGVEPLPFKTSQKRK